MMVKFCQRKLLLQDKQGVQYMVTGDGADIVQQHNGIATVATPVTQQYVQVGSS